MTRKGFLLAGVTAIGAVIGAGLLWRARRIGPLSDAAFAARYAVPLPPPDGPLRTYHLGHSLVGRDMPAMLAQLGRHDHASQLGWGASLQQHLQGDVPGFTVENAHPQFRDARAAIASGDFDAVILTEMVELRDAIRYHDSAASLAAWAGIAREANPHVRLYLYETWHRLDDPDGWLERIDHDLPDLWQGEILRPAMSRSGVGTIYVIPGGQVMAAAVRAIDAGDVPGLSHRADLFATAPDGTPDTIHLNDLGNYLIALAHHAVLYHRSPVGLPHDLLRADGTPMQAISLKTAQILQDVVWRCIARYPLTGVTQGL